MIDPVPESAASAWQAYNAMEATKNRYFSLLSGLESRYGSDVLAPTAERRILAALLDDHDTAVREFKRMIALLKNGDPEAHRSLVSRMVAINTTLSPYLQRHDN